MNLGLMSLYTEPGYTFSISHNVFNLINKYLTDNLMKPYGLSEKDKDKYLSVFVSTNKIITNVEVKGPDYDKRNKTVSYAIWLPFAKIRGEVDQRAFFIKYYFDGLVELFAKYGIKESSVREIQEDVEREVLGHPEYVYEEEYLPPPDLSDLGL